ncbi:MAG: GNAT family N-acetyltransferase, partial [Chitinophagales bacterium]
KQDYRYCNDDKWAKSMFDYCKIKNSKASDFKYRVLTCSLGEMVCSIRFVGGDMSKPAVFILHKDFALEKITDIRTVGHFLKEEYQNFSPKRIRWFFPKNGNELITSDKRIKGDLVYIAGFLSDIKSNTTFSLKEEVQLHETTSLDWFPKYQSAYQQMIINDPSYAEMGEMTTKETFQDLMKQNLVFEIKINNEWAGIIAASQENHHYYIGYEIYEEFLLNSYRGKGYASTTQRLLIEKMNAAKNNMLWGTIHYDNIASLKTAMKNGRKECGIYIFYTI